MLNLFCLNERHDTFVKHHSHLYFMSSVKFLEIQFQTVKPWTLNLTLVIPFKCLRSIPHARKVHFGGEKLGFCMKLVNDCKKRNKFLMVWYNLDFSTLKWHVMIIIEYFKDNKCNLFDLEIRKMHQNTNARKTFLQNFRH